MEPVLGGIAFIVMVIVTVFGMGVIGQGFREKAERMGKVEGRDYTLGRRTITTDDPALRRQFRIANAQRALFGVAMVVALALTLRLINS